MARKKSSTFQFKEFTVAHDRCAMKIGTDGVLLGAWANVTNANNILDVGTGSGVIALMLAQRTSGTAHIDAIEINETDASQAQENVNQSPWKNKVKVICTSFQDFSTPNKFDLIVSNPPFFDDSLPPSAHRAAARHTRSLSFSDFLDKAIPLLSSAGRLSVILPYQEGLEFIALAGMKYNFQVTRQTAVYAKPGKKQERWLLELQYDNGQQQLGELYIHTASGGWSADYQALTRAFYLNF